MNCFAAQLCRRGHTLSTEVNKALARRFLEATARADLDAMDEMMAPDFVDRSLMPGQEPDREGYKRSVAEMDAPFSHQRVTIEDQIAEGDKVLTRATFRGVHDRGEFLGMAPTGEDWHFTTMYVHRIAGGKIVEEWTEGDLGPFQERLNEEIRERELVEQELGVARTIQQANLLKEVPTPEDWQLGLICQPAREVGGDFYDFHYLSEGRLGLVVGDATGKGVPAALVMTGVCSFLGGVATAAGSSSPGEVLARVNEALLARIPPNMFVTCFYAILEPESGHLLYANAGHSLPCCRRKDAATDLSARGMPLGLMPGMRYEEKETILGPGEGVLFYTDGLIEAHNPQGEMFGTPRLRSLMSEHPMGGADLSTTLLEVLYSFVGEGWEQEDDITLLTLKRSASPS
jgi:serine phosphatase RsbU (regulator of sigma subunit)/ketosteroid isomerase-like protein